MGSYQLSFRKSSSEPLAKTEDQRLRALPARKGPLWGKIKGNWSSGVVMGETPP